MNIPNKLPTKLASSFIWIGGDFTEQHFYQMLAPIVANQRAFFCDAYELLPCLWVDRDMNPSVRQMVEEFGIEIHAVNELYEDLAEFLTENTEALSTESPIDIYKLKQFVALESGLIAPINKSTSGNQPESFVLLSDRLLEKQSESFVLLIKQLPADNKEIEETINAALIDKKGTKHVYLLRDDLKFFRYVLVSNGKVSPITEAVAFSEECKYLLKTETAKLENAIEISEKITRYGSKFDTSWLEYFVRKSLENFDVIEASNSYPLRSRTRPNPALAADIIKILLGLLHPGLFTDIGLTVKLQERGFNSKKWAANTAIYSSCIDQETGRFKDTVYFAPAGLHIGNPDLQIIYTTDKENCKQLHIKMLEAICAKTVIEVIRTMKQRPPCVSWTAAAWMDTLAAWLSEEIHQRYPGLSTINLTQGTFSGLTYKDRKNSMIPDYKVSLSELKRIDFFQRKKGDDSKIAVHHASTKSNRKTQDDSTVPICISKNTKKESLAELEKQNLLKQLKIEVIPLLATLAQEKFFKEEGYAPEYYSWQEKIRSEDISLEGLMDYFPWAWSYYMNAIADTKSIVLKGMAKTDDNVETIINFSYAALTILCAYKMAQYINSEYFRSIENNYNYNYQMFFLCTISAFYDIGVVLVTDITDVLEGVRKSESVDDINKVIDKFIADHEQESGAAHELAAAMRKIVKKLTSYICTRYEFTATSQEPPVGPMQELAIVMQLMLNKLKESAIIKFTADGLASIIKNLPELRQKEFLNQLGMEYFKSLIIDATDLDKLLKSLSEQNQKEFISQLTLNCTKTKTNNSEYISKLLKNLLASEQEAVFDPTHSTPK